MAVTTVGNLAESEVSRVREGSRKPLRQAAIKEINAVASFLGNQLFGNGKRRMSRCGSSGVGVIDFADVEEDCESHHHNWGSFMPNSRKKGYSRGSKTLRSPRGILQKMIPNNAAQLMQMDLILLDEAPSMAELQSCAWKGCCPRNRAQVWRMLLGHEPLQYSERNTVLEAKRKLYREYVHVLCAPEGAADLQLAFELKKCRSLQRAGENDITSLHNLKEKAYAFAAKGSREIVEYSDYSVKTLRQIEMDLPRTHPEIPIFHVPEVRDPMRRILYLYGMLNPNKNYVQGMNELVTPILVVFLSSYLKDTDEKGVESFLNRSEVGDTLTAQELADAEADAFWTFSLLVALVEDNFIPDQPGILKRVGRLDEIIAKVDPLLSKHLARNENEFIQFSYRWMNCLLMRELPFNMVVKLWDVLLAEEDGIADLHVYFCAAMLTRYRSELLGKGFEDCIMFLQHLPTEDWKSSDIDVLLSQAYIWKHSLQLPSVAS